MRSNSTTAIWAGVVVVLVVATSFLVRGVEASRSTGTAIPHVKPADFQSSAPVFDDSALSVDARVETRQRRLDETMRDIENVHRLLSNAKAKLAKAQIQQQQLPVTIRNLTDTLITLEQEIPAAATAIETARDRSAQFRSTITSRVSRVEAQADSVRAAQYSSSVDQIAKEREERNKERKRIGAQPEDQEEVLLTLRLRREAKRRTETTYSTTVGGEQAAVSAERSTLAHDVAEAEARHKRCLVSRSEALDQLTASKDALANADIAVAETPSQIASLETNLARLTQRKTTDEGALEIARRERQKRNEELAAAIAKASAERQIAQAGLNANSDSPRPETSALWSNASPSYSQNSRSGTGFSTGVSSSSRSSGYRSSTGSHYVDGYTRRDGAHVPGHFRTNADHTVRNNWSFKGNVNPHTGRVGSKR